MDYFSKYKNFPCEILPAITMTTKTMFKNQMTDTLDLS